MKKNIVVQRRNLMLQLKPSYLAQQDGYNKNKKTVPREKPVPLAHVHHKSSFVCSHSYTECN